VSFQAVDLPRRRSPSGIVTMTSQGTASGRFTRAIQRGHLLAAETAARGMCPGVLELTTVVCLSHKCVVLARRALSSSLTTRRGRRSVIRNWTKTAVAGPLLWLHLRGEREAI
jgi:hypothetical protein